MGSPSWMNSNGKPVAKAAEIFRSLRRELALAFSFLGNPAISRTRYPLPSSVFPQRNPPKTRYRSPVHSRASLSTFLPSTTFKVWPTLFI